MSNKEGKYVIHATIRTDGTVQRKDVVGAIFGQTEGLLGEDLQLRALQRNGRIGHVDVHLNQRKGSVNGEITLTTSMDQVSTSVIGAALETIDRIGPCKASIRVQRIENVVSAKRDVVIDRAKSLLMDLIGSGADESKNILEEVRSVLTVDTEISISGMTAGPNVKKADGIIIVEGRNDVRNLLKYGIKNAIAMMGAGVPDELVDLASKKKNVTAFLDGDRGGSLLLMELSGSLEKSLTHVAFAPKSLEVEHLEGKTITKCLNQKEAASKVVQRVKKQMEKDDNAVVGVEKADVQAPEIMSDWGQHLDGLKTNNAVIILEDGSATDPVGAGKLEAALEEVDNARGLVFAGKMSDRIFDLASKGGIENVLASSVSGTARKGTVSAYAPSDL